MGLIKLENQTEPSTPSSGNTRVYVDSVTKRITTKDDAGVVRSYGLDDNSVIPLLATMASTLSLEGADLSINSLDASKFDISAGTLIFSDSHLNPTNPTVTEYSYSGSTANINTMIAVQDFTLVMLDENGVVSLSALPDGTDNSFIRTKVVCGVLYHPNRSTITSIVNSCSCVPNQISSTLTDLNGALGFINLKNGNVYSGVPSSLSIQKSTGYLYGIGLNHGSSANPNIIQTTTQSPCTIVHTHRDGSGGFSESGFVTTLVPGRYDDNTGGSGGIPNGVVGATEWSVRYLYFSGSITYIQYGQSKYTSYSDAASSINRDIQSENPLVANSIFRGWIVLRGGATDLSLSTDAYFYSADKLGNRVLTGGLPTNTTTLQGAYNNSVEPEIKTSTTRGAVVIQDADTPTGVNLFEVKQSAAASNIFTISASKIEESEMVRFSGNGLCWDDLRVGGSLRPGANPVPTFAQLAGLGNIYLYKFGAATLDSLYATAQLPHGYKEGTDITPHIHWTTEDSNAGNIVWTLEYTWANYQGVFGASTTIEVTSANTTALTHNITSFGAISGTGKKISSVLMIRISRNGAAGADTYAGNASLIEFDIHFQKDSHGSDGVFTKTN